MLTQAATNILPYIAPIRLTAVENIKCATIVRPRGEYMREDKIYDIARAEQQSNVTLLMDEKEFGVVANQIIRQTLGEFILIESLRWHSYSNFLSSTLKSNML